MKREFYPFQLTIIVISVLNQFHCRTLSIPVEGNRRIVDKNVLQIFDKCKHISIIRTITADSVDYSYLQITNATMEVFDINIDDEFVDNDKCLNMNRFVSINDHFNYNNDESSEQKSLTQEKFDVIKGFVEKG